MKRHALKIAVPALFASANLFGSSLIPQPTPPPPPPPRVTVFDYALDKDTASSAYTLGVAVGATKVYLDYAIGTTGYNATNTANNITEGKTINFDNTVVASVESITKLSNSESGLIASLNVEYFNLAAANKTTKALSDSNIQIYDRLTEVDNSTEYNSVTYSLADQITKFKFTLSGFSLQYKGYGLSSQFGAVGGYMKFTTNVAGTETTGNNDVNKQVATQTTYSGGIVGGIEARLMVWESTTSGLYLGTKFQVTREYAHNTGNVTNTKTNGSTGAVTYADNTSPQAWTRQHALVKNIYLSFTQIPQQGDTSYVAAEVGIASDMGVGNDSVHKTSSGTEGSISTISVYGSLSYTM